MQRKPSLLDPASWPLADARYGKSPAMQVLDDLRALNALPPDERAKATVEFFSEHPELLKP